MCTSISMVDNFVEAWWRVYIVCGRCLDILHLVACIVCLLRVLGCVCRGCCVFVFGDGLGFVVVVLVEVVVDVVVVAVALPGTRCTAVCCVVHCVALFELTSRKIVSGSCETFLFWYSRYVPCSSIFQ